MTPDWRRVGAHGLLIEAGSHADVQAWHAAAVRERDAGRLSVREIVPAAATVLLDGLDDVDEVGAGLAAWTLDPGTAPDGGEVELAVAFDGPDLAAVAEHWGVSEREVVARITGTELTAAFGGFAPGFTYLTGLPPVPRRATPRTRVPAGAFALGGEYAGVYPRDTPGGWLIVGRTDAVVWDPGRDAPALIAPGARVRCIEAPVGESPVGEHAAPAVAHAVLEVVSGGPHVCVQDLGRPGLAHLGVPRSGAADAESHTRAQVAVGNTAQDASLEISGGGLRVRAIADTVLALAGPARHAFVGAVAAPWGSAFRVAAGQEVEVGPARHGLRAYLAVRGGIDAELELGSRASDVLSGVGPPPVLTGTTLGAGPEPAAPPRFGARSAAAPSDEREIEVPVIRGPRDDWFTQDAWDVFTGTAWTVTQEASRVGTRLSGASLVRARSGELPSEAMVPGAVQVPPSGQPVVFGPDHPVTGGYPVVAVATDEGRARLSQAPPGARVRFRWVNPLRA